MEFVENKDICAKCGGRCCKKSGCDYLPQDLETITLKGIIDILNAGNVSIVAALKFERLNGKLMGIPFLYLRARNIGKGPIDLFSFKTGCSLLTDNGCPYSFDERPSAGKALIPKDEGICDSTIDIEEFRNAWQGWQSTLRKAVKRITGKTVEEQLSLDVQAVMKQIITKDFKGIADVEIADMLSCIDGLIEAFEEEINAAYEETKIQRKRN